MKAIISNKIYMTVEPSLHRQLERELTYKIPDYNSQEQFILIKNLKVINYNINGNLLVAIPVGRTDLIPKGYEIVDKRATNYIENFPKFLGTLRPSQQAICDDLSDNCMINAPVGFGKTYSALAIAAKLKQKTLVLVHTVALRNQWEKEIKDVLGIKAGVIGSGRFNIDSPIVVANVQSLSKYVVNLAKEFGLLITDECHHISAPTFTKIIDGLFCRYKIGLSGTLERKDQKHVVFKDYFGHKIYKPEKENTMTPSVHIVLSGLEFPDGSAAWANRVTGLCESYLYQNLIANLADNYAAKGHKVLVVADRVEFLTKCSELSTMESDTLTGSLDEQGRDRLIKSVYNDETDIVYATQSLVSEGISINPLSCLILATPLNNMPLLEQLIGRVIRGYEGKLSPVIVDIRLEGHTVARQSSNRLSHYIKEGYEVKYIK